VRHPKGTAVTDIGMAINRVRNGENGERIEEATYIDVTLWGRQAELADQYLTKGRSVFIEGRLQLDTWDDKETGQKRSKLRVVGENMQFIGSSNGEASQKSSPSQAQEAPERIMHATTASNQPSSSDFDNEDEIPF